MNACGIAQANTLTLSAGPHPLVAAYGRNASAGYSASQSAALPYIVTAVPGASLAAVLNYPAGSGPRFVAVGDFDGDGKADLAVADQNGEVSVLLRNGNGSFQAAVGYPVGSVSTSVAVGDFNGDGKADLAVADGAGDTVNVLLGNGDGTFQSAIFSDAGSGPYSVTVGDFNGDGMADLAVANLNSNNVSVLLGNGDGTFQAGRGGGGGEVWGGGGGWGGAVNYGVGSVPLSVAVGDFNGDGGCRLGGG